nr:hypothetical protein [Tanacetum cinerariifolium]
DDFVHRKYSTDDEEAKGEESFDPIVQTPSHVESSDDKGNDDANHGMNVRGDEGPDAEDDDNELYRDLNINLEVQQAPAPSPATAPSTSPQDLLNFGSLFGFDHRLKTLEANFFEFMQTNQFAKAVSSILGIVDRYLDHRLNEAVKTAVQLQSDKLRDEAQAENEDFLNKLDENIQKIINEQVKEQVRVQVSKILPKIEKTVNEQLKAEVLTHVPNSSKTSYVVAADLSEFEIKKILIEKMESNKSIHRSDQQKNLYKALVDAYECDKIILDTYGDTITLKRCRDDKDKDKEPFAGSDKGATDDQPVTKASQHPDWFPQQAKPPTPDRAWNTTLPATHGRIQPWISDLAKQADSRTSFNELMDTPVDFSAFLMNWIKADTLTPELLAGPTYELMKGSCKSLVELKFFLEEVYKATTDQLDWNNPEGQQYPYDLLKPLPLIPNSRGLCVIPFDHFINTDLEYLHGGASSQKYTTYVTKTMAADYGHIKESARDVYSKHRIIAVTELQIVEWHNYKHLDWITVRRDNDKLYKFKEGDLKRLRIQDIKDMLLLLVQGKLTNLIVEERFAFNNKDKQNRLMCIDELHKFNDDTLNDVRTALDDRLKGIQMKYMPQTIWRRSDKERVATMIQAIDKQLKTRRIMRSLEKYVGGRLYEGDFRMLQQTI